jgi:23S rRNA maturation mini-RNase III
MPDERPTPKPRPLKLEPHILAYLGDFMSVFEESVKRKAIQTLKSSNQTPQAPSPGAR